MDEYKTIRTITTDTILERKSTFIATIAPVITEESAVAFVQEIKKKYADAKHNVYTFILRENNTTRFSDDGEPHGTAGLPVLELFRKEELTDVAIVVTRYFGGILLGTGGLVRAYTTAAKAALEKTEIVIYKKLVCFTMTVNYSDYPKVDFLLQSVPVMREKINFDTDVTMLLAIPVTDFEAIIKNINDITNGRAFVSIKSERYDYLNVK